MFLKGGGSDGENPKAAAVREQLRKRLSDQEEKERATKTELGQKAASYLEQFYEVKQMQLHRWAFAFMEMNLSDHLDFAELLCKPVYGSWQGIAQH